MSKMACAVRARFLAKFKDAGAGVPASTWFIFFETVIWGKVGDWVAGRGSWHQSSNPLFQFTKHGR